nr:ribonuclease H-like domain-containing protein [Tanacetum cinerariifolium]GEY14672.1 ribonuclease H-like domain-containing protein [Tanacetum cinerariifolium]
PNWRDAMYDEYNALIKNNTWVLVPKPPNVNVVWCVWLFRHKYHAEGSLSRYKTHLVANERSQQFGVDCDDSFSYVVKPVTIRTVLSLALSRSWLIHQLDVKNVFLNDDFSKTVYMHQPPGYAYKVDFSSSHCDSSLFIYQHSSEAVNIWLLCFLERCSTLMRALLSATLFYCDNVSAIYITANHDQIDIHFVRDMVACGQVRVFHVSSRYQVKIHNGWKGVHTRTQSERKRAFTYLFNHALLSHLSPFSFSHIQSQLPTIDGRELGRIARLNKRYGIQE